MISLADKEFVRIHIESVQVNVILHVSPAFNPVLLGIHQLHSGAVASKLNSLLVELVFQTISFTYHE